MGIKEMKMLKLLQLLLLLLLLLLQGHSVKGGIVQCKPSALELVFAVDVSSSLTLDDFADLKKFLTEVAESLPIEPMQTRPAIISFSTNATIEANLGQVDSSEAFKQRVQAIPYYRGFTATGLAMQLARTSVFTRSRPEASKLLVVITDGRTNHPGTRLQALELMTGESAELAAAAVRVHAVGVGDVWLEEELRFISGGDDFSMIDNYKNLHKIVKTLVQDICEVHCTDVGKLTKVPGQCFNGTQRITYVRKTHNHKLNRCEKSISYHYHYCGKSHLCKEIETKIGDCVNGKRSVVTFWEDFDVNKQRCVRRESVKKLDCKAIEECKEPVADIIFILDSSGSIKKRDWYLQKKFVMRIIASMRISRRAIRIGLVIFGSKAKTVIQLGSRHSKPSLISYVRRLKQPKRQATNTGLGIRFASVQFKKRGRSKVKHLAILMTDGASNRGPNAIREATRLEGSGVDIIVVGVGKRLRKQELRAIATPPLKDHLFYARDFKKLMAWAEKVSEESCESITPPNPKLCDLPPKRVISSCYRGVQKITIIRYVYDSDGICSKKLVSRSLDKCPLLCTDPINGNQYYEGERWQTNCHTFACRRQRPRVAFKPIGMKCQSASNKCESPSNQESVFNCHDETGKLFSHCSCKVGSKLSIVTADGNSHGSS